MMFWRDVMLPLMIPFSTVVAQQQVGTPQEREALFDTLVNRTARWEAWSPYKERKNAVDYPVDAAELRTEFRAAGTELELIIALQKLSNLRHDRHLFVDEGFPDVRDLTAYAPIAFWPDFTSGSIDLFVADTAINAGSVSGEKMNFGDRLLRINGIRVRDYYKKLLPFLRFSTYRQSLWTFAETISTKHSLFDPSLYANDDRLELELIKSNGSIYSVDLPYSSDRAQLTGNGRRSLTGYEFLFSNIDVEMFVKYTDHNIIILLLWKDFEQVSNTIFQIIEKAKEYDILNAHVILDISQSSGGSGSPELVRILAKKPFQTTLGNVRIGNYLDDFKLNFSGSVREWLDTDVAEARNLGYEFSENVPFKLQYFSKTQEGIMDPAQDKFLGEVVLITGSNTGSQVDQCAAMMIDNDIPVASLGMPCGGYSNTWEYEPEINFPEGSDNWFEYHWNIGHTIRPNGEVLEGNPANPEYWYLLSRENFLTYYDDLIQAAEDTLNSHPLEISCLLESPDIFFESGKLATKFDPTYSYQWLLNGDLIEGETNRIFLGSLTNGEYQVRITRGLCQSDSKPLIVEALGAEATVIEKIRFYPQPVDSGLLTVCSKPFLESALLYHISGSSLGRLRYTAISATCYEMDLVGFAPGIYFVLFSLDGGHFFRKIIIE